MITMMVMLYNSILENEYTEIKRRSSSQSFRKRRQGWPRESKRDNADEHDRGNFM